MQLPPCVFLSASELNFGADLVLYTRSPFYVGRVIKFSDGKAMENFIKKYNLLGNCGISKEYYLLVCYIGNLESISDSIPLGHTLSPDIVPILTKFVNYYEEGKIEGNEKRFTKYKR